MRYNRNHTKGIAMILCFVMLFSTMATTVFAMGPEESVDTNLTIEQMEKPSSSDASSDAGDANTESGGQETDETPDNSEKGEPDFIIEIASFLPLDEEVANQIVPDEAALEALDLPQTLMGTNAQGEAVEIPVTWEREPVFDPDNAESIIGYSYTPVLPEGYALAEGVELPTIQVAVMEAATFDVGKENVIEVSGETTWSAIQTQIDKILADNSDASIKISGIRDGAVITMDVDYTDDNRIPELGAALELHSDTTFENVTFQLRGQYSTNEQPNIAMFANGHKLHITGDVKTEHVGDYSKSMFIFGGSRETGVESTNLEIYGGTWARIYGGSYRSDCGDTYIYVGGNTDVRDVYGGCFGAKTTGNIEIEYGSAANDHTTVNGGGHDVQYEEQIADVTGEKIEIEILPGALLAEVNGAVNSMISCDDVYITVDDGARVLSSVSGGAVTSRAEDWSLANGYAPYENRYTATSHIHVVFNSDGRRDENHAYSTSVTGGGIYGNVDGTIDVTINGNVEFVYGGSHNGDVTGDINITINGGVYAGGHNADVEIGDIYTWCGGTVTSGCIAGTVTGNITTTINKGAEVHSVIGGSDDGCVVGDTNVHVYGTVLKKNYESANRALRYAGSVFGGGFIGEEDFIDVNGNTFVYVYEGAVVEGDVHGGAINGRVFGDTHIEVTGTVNGDVYGGGLNSYGYPGGFWTSAESNPRTVVHPGIVYGNTNVKICGTGTANNVYGSGKAATVGGYIITTEGKSPLQEGNTNVLLEGNASVQNVCGTGNPESGRWGRGEYIEEEPSSPTVYGNATITIREQAKVADTVYGFAWFEADDEKYSTVSEEAKVSFRASDNESVFKRVENANLVQVTNGSKVEIDNEHKDNEQLVNVADLTIDDSATLRIGADVHILGNYQGDAAKSGTLEIPAGKCLTADGTVTDLTKISIYDFNSVIPVKAQIYVISGAGSTTDDGDFTWIDTRNGVYMDWKKHETIEDATQWWLVNDPNPERYGSLMVSKTVAGDGGDKTKDFHFTVTLSDKTISGKFGDMEFTDGVATFTLQHGESKTAENLPANVVYTVTEIEANSEGYTTMSTDAGGTITADGTAVAAFVNTKNGGGTDPDPQTGDLMVSKTVSGNRGDTSKDFSFTVTLGDTSIDGKYGDMTFHDGVAAFTLRHGQSMKASGLPAGIRYTVAESDNAGYTVTSSGETGSIMAGETAVALFNNHMSGGDSGNDDVDVSVKKVWKLDDGGKAADAVTAVLLRDGKEYQRVELNEQNGWTYTWTGLSDKYTWSVSEVNVPDGFTMKVEQNGNVWTITNDDKPITPPDPTDPDKPTNPDKPTEPTTPSKPDKPKDDTPQTGDESNLILWLALLGISGMGVMVTLLFSKRKYRGKHSKR